MNNPFSNHVDKLFSDLTSHAGKPIMSKEQERGATVEAHQAEATGFLAEYERHLRKAALFGSYLEGYDLSLEDLDLLNKVFGKRPFIDGHIENLKAQIAGMEE